MPLNSFLIWGRFTVKMAEKAKDQIPNPVLSRRCRSLLSRYFWPSRLLNSNKTPNISCVKPCALWRRRLMAFRTIQIASNSVHQIFLLFSSDANPTPLLLPQGYNKRQQLLEASAAQPHPFERTHRIQFNSAKTDLHGETGGMLIQQHVFMQRAPH